MSTNVATVSEERAMTGDPGSHSHPREPDSARSRSVHVNAANIFASDPNGDPIEFRDDENDHEPVDNLAAPVGIISAVVVGLILWAMIILVIYWLK
jgi:hypothetical protein